jgi:anti-sigma factor RsiW
MRRTEEPDDDRSEAERTGAFPESAFPQAAFPEKVPERSARPSRLPEFAFDLDELLHRYAEGELDEFRVREVRAIVTDSQEARVALEARFAERRELIEALAASAAHPPPPSLGARFARRVAERVEQDLAARRAAQRWKRLRSLLPYAAAILLGAGFLIRASFERDPARSGDGTERDPVLAGLAADLERASPGTSGSSEIARTGAGKSGIADRSIPAAVSMQTMDSMHAVGSRASSGTRDTGTRDSGRRNSVAASSGARSGPSGSLPRPRPIRLELPAPPFFLEDCVGSDDRTSDAADPLFPPSVPVCDSCALPSVLSSAAAGPMGSAIAPAVLPGRNSARSRSALAGPSGSDAAVDTRSFEGSDAIGYVLRHAPGNGSAEPPCPPDPNADGVFNASDFIYLLQQGLLAVAQESSGRDRSGWESDPCETETACETNV